MYFITFRCPLHDLVIAKLHAYGFNITSRRLFCISRVEGNAVNRK